MGVVIPTFHAGRWWPILHAALERQGLDKSQVLIIDSSSGEGFENLVRDAGYNLVTIEAKDFNHGGTRQAGSRYLPWAEIIIYLTQDAIPADDHAFAVLCEAFRDPSVGAAYGRQIPRAEADPIERHARLFNYAEKTEVRSFQDSQSLGIKAAFLSNSFAAYRASALTEVGGFPPDVIMAEDSVVAAKMLLSGWKIAYQSDAVVVHSHPLSMLHEFRRYFDTGAHHAREHWLLEEFGTASSEGKRFVTSELRFLQANGARWIPKAMLRTLSKWVAYQVGRREQSLPLVLKRKLSTHPGFWTSDRYTETLHAEPRPVILHPHARSAADLDVLQGAESLNH